MPLAVRRISLVARGRKKEREPIFEKLIDSLYNLQVIKDKISVSACSFFGFRFQLRPKKNYPYTTQTIPALKKVIHSAFR